MLSTEFELGDYGDHLEDEQQPLGPAEWFADPAIHQQLLEGFLEVQGVSQLRPWQQAFIDQPLEAQTSQILQLPPGAGKTLIAQWVCLEQLMAKPRERILFAVPLRVLAAQLQRDLMKTLDWFRESISRAHAAGIGPAGLGSVDWPGFLVGLAEGPGASVNLIRDNIVVATYEHAAGELKRDPWVSATVPGAARWVGLVIIDEIHNIAKGDRGMVIDDLLFFAGMRAWARDRRVGILGMSGTLPDWVANRLIESFPIFTQGKQPGDDAIKTPESFGETPAASKPPVRRLILPEPKFSTPRVAQLAREILAKLLEERLNGNPRPRRMVAFFSTVAEAEAAFLYVATDPSLRRLLLAHRKAHLGEFVAPAIRLATKLDRLADLLQGVDTAAVSRNTREALTGNAVFLESAGVYLHHAQLKGPRPTEDQPQGWNDLVSEQLGTRDFVAVFCTSTLSVGINLVPTQVAILGPNSMWTIDQAEQMIGRVGRADADRDSSVALVVDSPAYSAPGLVTIEAPAAWFVPRLAAVLDFARVEAERRLSRGQSEVLEPLRNIDIRGFFRPVGCPAFGVPDLAGLGPVANLARAWGLVEGDHVAPGARLALNLCKQDLKSLPCTLWLLKRTDSEISWGLVLLWALMVVRLPPRWETAVRNPKGEPKVTVASSQPRVVPPKLASELVELFGCAHRAYPGDPDVPSKETADAVLDFFHVFVYSVCLEPAGWFSEDPVDLLDLVASLAGFIDPLFQALLQLPAGSSNSIASLVGAFSSAFQLLAAFLRFPEAGFPGRVVGLPQPSGDSASAFSATLRALFDSS